MRFAYGDWVTATFVATCFFFFGPTVLGCINETAPHYRATARAEATTTTATSLAASAWHGRRYPWGHEDRRQRTEDRTIRRHEVEARHCLAQIICDAQTPTGQASTSITLAQVAVAVADGVGVKSESQFKRCWASASHVVARMTSQFIVLPLSLWHMRFVST